MQCENSLHRPMRAGRAGARRSSGAVDLMKVSFYARLVSLGKKLKQAMTACMRKLHMLMEHSGGPASGLGPVLRGLIPRSEPGRGAVGKGTGLDAS